MNDELDTHGQPLNKAFSWNRLKDSRMDELIGELLSNPVDGF